VLRLDCCGRPVGESPVRVSAGAPGSRPRFVGEIRRAERASRASLEGASTRAATAASSNTQSGSRAVHVAVKAMSASPGSGSGAVGPCGVREVARVHGLVAEHGRPVWAASSAKTVRISRW
jgi:hypothetical protein